jgi:hypothetical protein
MKFTKPDENGILCNKMLDTHSEAVRYFGSDENIIPAVGINEWNKKPNDYKGSKDGKPYLLYLTDKGTTYGECAIVYSV